MLRDEVALAQAPPRALGEEVLHARVLVRGVVAVAQRVGLLAAGAADRVVAAALVVDDRHQRAPLVAAQDAAGGQEDVALGGDRVGRAVALGGVVGAVEQAVDGLVAAAGRRSTARGRPRRPPTTARGRDRPGRAPSCQPPRGRVVVGVRAARARARASPRAADRRARSARRARRAARASSTPLGRVERMRRVRDEHDHRQLAAQLDAVVRARRCRRSVRLPSGSTRTPWKNDTLGGDVARLEPVLGGRERRTMPRAVARAAQRVVAPGVVGDDRRQHAALVGEQRMAGAEIRLPGDLHRVGDVQPLPRLRRRCRAADARTRAPATSLRRSVVPRASTFDA